MRTLLVAAPVAADTETVDHSVRVGPAAGQYTVRSR